MAPCVAVNMMVLLCGVFGCRVLAIQSQSKDADVQKRVLQTMVMVVTWKSCDMTEDTVAQVHCCYVLLASGVQDSAIVSWYLA